MKKVAVIPTLLTLANAVCGFAAIACASKIEPEAASTEHYFALSGWLIVLAMLFDAMDGYVARLSRVASKFGGELDSLCDGISFGLGPAFLLMRLGPGWEPWPLLHRALAGIAALYLVCALLRLARFNVENTLDPAGHKRFRGLPSPAAAGCLASLAIVRGNLTFPRGELAARLPAFDLAMLRGAIEAWATLGALVIALLMVSRVPYPHLTKQILGGRRHFRHLVQVIVGGFIVLILPEVALVLVFWLYGLGVPLQHTLLRSMRRETIPIPAGPGLDDILGR